jgi:tricorn protease
MNQLTHLPETLLLKQPTISAEEICFLYAGDIWIAARDGSHPHQLTAEKGSKSSPIFSPDGQWIAFSGNYDGNLSVYVISRMGGSPRRLAYHPYDDLVRGWTPDGKHILFASARDSTSMRYRKLFTVPLEGGLPTPLPMEMAERGSYSPDSTQIAYTAYFEAFWSWKRYRGGMTVPIWVLDLQTYDHVEIPHENASDTFPCWVGESIYFLSDRNGVMNLFRWQVNSKNVDQVTFHTDFDVRSLTANGDSLAYEQAGRIHIFNTNKQTSTSLCISIAADLPETRRHYQKAHKAIHNCGISPTGARVVFEARGDLFTVPVKKGDIRNLTKTPGVMERDPAWSPDGQSIAFFSDASGEYALVIVDQKGAQKKIFPLTELLNKKTFFHAPTWSPDSKKIAFTDKALNVYYLDLERHVVTHVDADTYDHPDRTLDPAWSPDSQWLVYTRRLDNQIRTIFLYHVETKQIHQVTDGMIDTISACFSRDGKYLFFAGSTNYGLNTGWLDMSSYDRPILRHLYAVVLSREDPSPLAPESDEEKDPTEKKAEGDEKPKAEDDKSAEPDAASKVENEPKKPVTVKIDFEGIAQRIVSLPIPPSNYLRVNSADDKLFFLEIIPGQPLDAYPPACRLKAYDFKERKVDDFVDKLLSYWVSADGKKLLYQSTEPIRYAIIGTENKPDPNHETLNLDAMQNAVDPRAEWRQMFREAYRIHRDYFYDTAMHGVDLESVYQKYLPFLEHVGHRDDLNYLLGEFSGELIAGHAYVAAGDIPSRGKVPVGLLGADYEVTPEGYYRIRRIYVGENWHPELRSPLTEPGVNVQVGEYILAVNGQLLRLPTIIYQLFENTVERITDLLVGPNTNIEEARTVSVRPIADETALRHWAWVEGNRRKVDELTSGRVAYVYMPNTAMAGYDYFNRYYFSQLNKEAVILDERFNGGGSVADYVIDLLNRPILSYWATREGKPFATPNASIFGPKVMIINELAGSGGDAMPLFFRRRGLGKLIGKRTWGGLIGIYDYPILMDGGMFTSPRMAIFSPEGEWEVENVGVAPDIGVEMTPKLVIAGHDPQLEKAVEVVLAELNANTPKKVTRPMPAIKVEMRNT